MTAADGEYGFVGVTADVDVARPVVHITAPINAAALVLASAGECLPWAEGADDL